MVEKARLCGLARHALDGLVAAGGGRAEVAVGNTIPVPMICHVLAPILRMWQEGVRLDWISSDPS